jgi:XrtN system VIT domain protein
METSVTPQQTKKLTESSFKQIITDKTTYLGYLLLAISLLLFTIEEYAMIPRGEDFKIFTLHYIMALLYVVILLINRSYGIRKSWSKLNIHKTIILLNLFLISAYTLNRSLPIFADAVPWLCAYILGTSFIILSFQYFKLLPTWANRIQQIGIGSAMILYLYKAVYVSELYAFGAVGTIFFGIGFHIFIPIVLLIGSVFLIRHTHQIRKASIYWVAAGSVFSILVVLSFMGEWNARISKIDKVTNQSVMYPDNDLPAWLSIAESIENDWISERILKSDIVYTTYAPHRSFNFFPRRFSWDEVRMHDPLVFISSMISKCSLPQEDRIKILQTVSTTNRHRAKERLWSGDNLTTSYIISDVDIYPALRIAYLEKYLNVKNNVIDQRWGNTQEGIYTFQLPEGGVVTSLSLWINGKEEKGILTSKQKATKAYNTIVGVERRDPSVVHWQEGNTVTVRVFPCTPDEERKFKIGITAPLIEKEGQLVFNNLDFKGPDPSRAKETLRVRFLGDAGNVELSSEFQKDKNGDFVREKLYDSNFELSFDSMPVAENRFTFDGFTYAIHQHKPTQIPAEFEKIFLDINNSWTSREVDIAASWLDAHHVYGSIDNQFVQLTDENWSSHVDKMRERNFSLFPFHLLATPENSVVVTKGKALSPHLSDIKESLFAEKIMEYFGRDRKVKVFNLGEQISTYVGSLREFRALEFAGGDITEFDDFLERRVFPVVAESDNKIVLHDAKLCITKEKKSASVSEVNNAPDHLARLFAYNNIMRRVGNNYFNEVFVNEELVDEAATAYVVSPVSSLIVLETKKDYDRFGIADTENSLHNASKESLGAVPEPHEWALIILLGALVIYLRFRQFKLRTAI